MRGSKLSTRSSSLTAGVSRSGSTVTNSARTFAACAAHRPEHLRHLEELRRADVRAMGEAEEHEVRRALEIVLLRHGAAARSVHQPERTSDAARGREPRTRARSVRYAAVQKGREPDPGRQRSGAARRRARGLIERSSSRYASLPDQKHQARAEVTRRGEHGVAVVPPHQPAPAAMRHRARGSRQREREVAVSKPGLVEMRGCGVARLPPWIGLSDASTCRAKTRTVLGRPEPVRRACISRKPEKGRTRSSCLNAIRH